LSTFTSADIARICWAFAFLSISHDPLMAAIANLIVLNGVLATFTPQDMATVLWAFTMNIQNQQLTAAAVAAAQAYLSSNAGMANAIPQQELVAQMGMFPTTLASGPVMTDLIGTQP
jgi:hypothetical protein